jgi:acetyl esterase/lipase
MHMNHLPRRIVTGLVTSLAVLAAVCLSAPAQEKSVKPGINQPFENPNVKEYIGKFEVESREIFAKRAEIVAACQIKPGMAVADIGAGTGLFTRLFAPAVGPKGRVYAVDIAPKFIEHIEKTCKESGIQNVVGVVCTPTAVKLPPRSVDLAFICDTYHHFEFPFKTMQTIHDALRPGGQLVLIDFHRIEGKSSAWVLNHVRAGQEVFTREIVSSGFKKAGEQDLLKENYLVRFERVEPAQGQASEPVRTFTYKKTKQADLEIHVHYPPGWNKDDKRPAIVFFFGGGWNQGSVQQFEPQATYLASRGMVAARADYRVKSRHDVTPAECVEDAKSAVRWLRKNAAMLGVNPDRIVASGGSAGGHIAACTAGPDGLEGSGEDISVSSRPNALLLFNPVLRFQGYPDLTGRIGNDEKLAKLLSPTLHLTKHTPPALLFFGKEDRLLAQGEEFLARSKETGNRAEMFLADGVGHGFFNRSPWREKTLLRADEFLTSLGYLIGRPTVTIP